MMKALLFLLIAFNGFSQTYKEMLEQVNAMRSSRHQLSYNYEKQDHVDKYAASDQFLKRFQHSIGGNHGEIIIQSPSKEDMVDKWRASKHHRRVMVNSYYKSMACKIVFHNNTYYGVIQFFP